MTGHSNTVRCLQVRLAFNQMNECFEIVFTCLATDASQTADPGVASLIPVWSHTFMEIDHEIISTVILLPSAESFKKDLSVTSESMCTKYWLTACSSLPRKKCG